MKIVHPFHSSKVEGLAAIEVQAFQGGRKTNVQHIVVADDDVVALATRRRRSVVLVSAGWMRRLSYGDIYYRKLLVSRLLKLGVVTSDQQAGYLKEAQALKEDKSRSLDVASLRQIMSRRGSEFDALLKRARRNS